MARGGKQPGSGRPKGSKGGHTLEAAKAREYVINRVTTELEPIITGHIESAKGIWMEDLDKEGNRIRVYRKAPDTRAIEFLIDQTIGRANQSIDVKAKVDQTVTASPEALRLSKEYEEKIKKAL